MPTFDLSTPPPAPTGVLDALPRRVALTLPELRLVAERAGGAPLPFDITQAADAHVLDDRLGRTPSSAEDAAYADTLASLHDPAVTLERRGLLVGTTVDDGLAGAVGLLATPSTAVDLDVTVEGRRAHAWHRHSGGAVATLSTVDGIVFELAWFESGLWAGELARAGQLPDDLSVGASDVPPQVDLPFEVADAAAEAMQEGRTDLLPVLAAQHSGSVLGADDRPLTDGEVPFVLAALSSESRGRLRALVADVSEGSTDVVGVVSWTLLADGWHALRPRRDDGGHRVEVRRVEPQDLAAELAPVLAEVRA